MRETDQVTVLPGVGEKTAGTLRQLGIESVGDLLRHYPVRYEKLEEPVPIAEAESGKVVTLRGVFSSQAQTRRTGSLVLTTISLRDGSGLCRLTWFRMPYLANSLHKGDACLVRGRLLRGTYGVTMEQPKIYREQEYFEQMRSLQPVYPLTGKLSGKQMGKYLRAALEGLDLSRDPLPRSLREAWGLAEYNFALRSIHFPQSEEDVRIARERLVFEEFLLFILGIRRFRDQKEEQENRFAFPDSTLAEQLLSSLPYELTAAQKRVWGEIRQDMTGGRLMNRLVQGDVGSGKTVLALLALVLAAGNGYQGALMAPTEVLAAQHLESIQGMLQAAGLPLRPLLLTGSMTAAQKREAYAAIEAGEADIVIGTHALIQDKVRFAGLALVVTDEQHRFGVHQRETLAGKGESPHILVMSATPIPRTLAIILYGDLDISVVDELPKNRQPIKNCVVGPSWRPKAYDFIRRQVEAGRQAYVICPMVEESEGLDAENVTDYKEKLKAALPPEIRVEMLHGKMKPKEKNERMEAFARGEIQVLVSTTVVEVGVNVPNATVMMVENAERFGLAQLHQLRGRVGRGKHQSYCIFLDGSGDPEKNKRLQILNHSNDGFAIASEDLKLRGPGDIFGIRQSGVLEFALGDIYTDARILQDAAAACDRILAEDPGLESEEYRPLREALERKLEGPETLNL